MGKTVLIIGAGCSMGSVGFPTDKEMLLGKISYVRDNYYFLGKALDKLYTYYPHSRGGLDWSNYRLEVEWSEIVANINKPKIVLHPDEIEELYNKLKELSKKEKDSGIKRYYYYWYQNIDREARTPYEYLFTFANWEMKKLIQETYANKVLSEKEKEYYTKLLGYCKKDGNDLEIVSFNYDVLMEQVLTDYYYERVDSKQKGIKIIKPHGSVNWMQITEVHQEVYRNWEDSISEVKNNVMPITLEEMGWESGRFYHPSCVGLIDVKKEYGRGTTALFYRQNIGQGLRDSLSDTDRIVIIGYSFPSGDRHIRNILQEVKEQRQGRKKLLVQDIIIVNLFKDKDGEEQMENTLTDLFSASNIETKNERWEEWIMKESL